MTLYCLQDFWVVICKQIWHVLSIGYLFSDFLCDNKDAFTEGFSGHRGRECNSLTGDGTVKDTLAERRCRETD